MNVSSSCCKQSSDKVIPVPFGDRADKILAIMRHPAPSETLDVEGLRDRCKRDFMGGYDGDKHEVFVHGMDTVCNVLAGSGVAPSDPLPFRVPYSPNPDSPPIEVQAHPAFEAVWQAIKGWDVERARGKGYAAATGTDVAVILNALSGLSDPQPDGLQSLPACGHRSPGECGVGCYAVDKRGLHEKFVIRRTDGSDNPGGKHADCRYFVLDVTHDEHAKPALRAYAKSCQHDKPTLAEHMVDEFGLERTPREEQSPPASGRLVEAATALRDRMVAAGSDDDVEELSEALEAEKALRSDPEAFRAALLRQPDDEADDWVLAKRYGEVCDKAAKLEQQLAAKDAEIDRCERRRKEWEGIAEMRECRIVQIGQLVENVKTSSGFRPVCNNEIVEAVQKLRDEHAATQLSHDNALAALKDAGVEAETVTDGIESLDRIRQSLLTEVARLAAPSFGVEVKASSGDEKLRELRDEIAGYLEIANAKDMSGRDQASCSALDGRIAAYRQCKSDVDRLLAEQPEPTTKNLLTGSRISSSAEQPEPEGQPSKAIDDFLRYFDDTECTDIETHALAELCRRAKAGGAS